MDKLTITSLTTTRVNILNLKEYDNIQLHVTINRNTTKVSADSDNSYFSGDYTATMIRTDETPENRTFLVEYSVHANFICNNPQATPESIVSLTTAEIYPHLRSGVSAIMGASGIHPILLPPTVL